jgi:Rab proteins geranylgeranyltransferase component A
VEYNLPVRLRNTVQYAIAMSPTSEISASEAIPAIQRHLKGFGMYGNFPLLVPLHGGGGELAQAFSRSAAVKGATYILGRDISQISESEDPEYPVRVEFKDAEDLPVVQCKTVITTSKPLPSGSVETCHSVAVIDGVLDNLFAEGSMYKDAAIVIIPPGVVRHEQDMPIQVIIHGGGTGECPGGQCIAFINKLTCQGLCIAARRRPDTKDLKI